MLIKIEEIKKKLRKENIVPIAKQFSCDTLTPVSAFLRLNKKSEKSFFLESVEGGEKLGRYCFLGINPFEIIKIRDNVVSIEREERPVTYFNDLNPFEVVKSHLKKYRFH